MNPEEIVADAGTVDLGRFANVSFDDKTPRLSPTQLLLAAVFIVVTIRAAMVFIIAMVENSLLGVFEPKVWQQSHVAPAVKRFCVDRSIDFQVHRYLIFVAKGEKGGDSSVTEQKAT